MSKIVFEAGTAYRVVDEEYVALGSLARSLSLTVEIADDKTMFDDIWRYIEADAEIYDEIFSAALGNFDLQIYIDQFKKPSRDRSDDDPNNSMNRLEVGWSASVYQGELAICTDFGGVGMMTDAFYQQKEPEEIGYAVEFTPINDLKGYPFFINDRLVIHDDEDYKNTVFEGKREFTVYDMIHAILFEISFIGTPQNQMAFFAEMDQRVSEMKEILDIEADEE